MELESAIQLLKKAVKNNATNDQKHIDLTLVSADERGIYQEALETVQKSIKDGKIGRDDFLRRVNIS